MVVVVVDDRRTIVVAWSIRIDGMGRLLGALGGPERLRDAISLGRDRLLLAALLLQHHVLGAAELG